MRGKEKDRQSRDDGEYLESVQREYKINEGKNKNKIEDDDAGG